MDEPSTLAVTLKDTTVKVTRFDEVDDDTQGYEYHGFYLHITGPELDVTARKYDNEAEISIQQGVTENEAAKLEIIKTIGIQLFNCPTLTLLTSDANPPYTTLSE